MPDPDPTRTAHLPPSDWRPPPPAAVYLAERVERLEATVANLEATIDHLNLMLTLAAEALRPNGSPDGSR